MNKTVFVDFNGIPGCGKSTICKKTIRKFEESKMTVRFLQDDIKRYSSKKIIIPFLILCEAVQGGGQIIIKYIQLYNSLPKETKQIKFVLAALSNYMLARKITRECDADYVFSDQCVIQDILSCFYDQKIGNVSIIRETMEQVLVDFREFIRVDIDIDVDISKSRILKRKASGGRLDKIEEQYLLPILSIQQENLNKLRSCGCQMKHLNIRSVDEADKNADYIVNLLLGKNLE